MAKISIIVPAFNEEGVIEKVIADLKKYLSQACEIIVVNDGSTDFTGEVVGKIADIKVINHSENRGYGAALKSGIRKSQGEYILIIDADGTYAAADLIKLFNRIEDGYDMVVGARKEVYHPFLILTHPARFIFRFLCEFALGRRIPDINSGLRVFKKSVAEKFRTTIGQGYSFTTSLTLILFIEGYFVDYLPVSYKKRKGTSKVRFIRDSLRAGQIIIETILRYNPIKPFILISTFTFLVSFLFLSIYAFSTDSVMGQAGFMGFYTGIILMAIGFMSIALKK